jgi:L-2,4-diaminobutyrate decarboxylase
MECTRPMAALRVFALLATHGDKVIGDSINTVFASARDFAELIRTTSGFELLTTPTANIVCYRLAPTELTGPERDTLNTATRSRLIADGDFYIVETKIAGRTWLRSAIMNPFTSMDHFRRLLDALLAISVRSNPGNG